MRDIPREKIKIRPTTKGINTTSPDRAVPEKTISRNRGARENIKCTKEETTTDIGKIDLGR